jgi:hypothetical protein
MTRQSSRRGVGLLALVAIAVLAVTGTARLLTAPSGESSQLPLEGPAFVFREFGMQADTLWLASAFDPTVRRRIVTVPHAPEWGIFAALSPDGGTVAFTAIGPDAASATATAPADLWFVDSAGTNLRRVASGIDLRVTPVWAPDSRSVVVRRSHDGPDGSRSYELMSVNGDGSSQTFVAGSALSVFPVGFATPGDSLYYTQLSPDGTDFVLTGPDGIRSSARLSTDLTREWRLSPNADRVAFLAPETENGRLQFRVRVSQVDGTPVAVTGGGQHLSPDWHPDGTSLTFAADGSVVTLNLETGERHAVLVTPSQGFDVPIAWSGDASLLAVRHFEGASLQQPGRQRLVIAKQGSGRVEVGGPSDTEFIGWMAP